MTVSVERTRLNCNWRNIKVLLEMFVFKKPKSKLMNISRSQRRINYQFKSRVSRTTNGLSKSKKMYRQDENKEKRKSKRLDMSRSHWPKLYRSNSRLSGSKHWLSKMHKLHRTDEYLMKRKFKWMDISRCQKEKNYLFNSRLSRSRNWPSKINKVLRPDECLIILKPGSVQDLIGHCNLVLNQLPSCHKDVEQIILLNERLTFLLYYLNKPSDHILEPKSLFKDLYTLFGDLLHVPLPRLDVLYQLRSPTRDLDQSVTKFTKNIIAFENQVQVISDFLGIAPQLHDKFKQLDDKFRYHLTYKNWLVKFLEDNYNELIETFNEQEELATSLITLGFTEAKSEYIGSLIQRDLRQLHSPYFWAVRYLNNSFHHECMQVCVPKFIFQPDKVNEWFDQCCDYDDDDDNSCKLVKMINLTSEEAELQKVRPLLDNSWDFVFLYHGTSYQSCMSLIRDGIKLSRGSANQDFSSLDGFYLSEDLEDAKRWGSAGRGDSYAVLVYKVRRDFMDAEKVRGLDLNSFEEWNKVVKHCRSDYEIELDASVQLENVSFIRGPRASGQAFLDGHLGRNFQTGNFIQVCIRDEEYAALFGKRENVFCALFY